MRACAGDEGESPLGGRHVHDARRLLEKALDEATGDDLVRAARAVVGELGSAERLLPLVRELAGGAGDPSGRALLSYRHVLGFDKLLLIDGGPRHMLRAHIWHPGPAGREDIHNHRSPLASYVVRGALGMELYETAGPGTDGGVAAASYRESLSDDGADWLLEPAGGARLRLALTMEYAAGSGYALPPYTLHRAWCASAGPTVTLFLETGAGRRRYTDVFTGPGAADAGAMARKKPLDVRDYLAELSVLAELIG
ncbi:Cysteine dioxygenase OS=Streptomyces alboniger OX=132473 GN=CP975_28630 PE=4 SV=1 [Streptomyces alboniger]